MTCSQPTYCRRPHYRWRAKVIEKFSPSTDQSPHQLHIFILADLWESNSWIAGLKLTPGRLLKTDDCVAQKSVPPYIRCQKACSTQFELGKTGSAVLNTDTTYNLSQPAPSKGRDRVSCCVELGNGGREEICQTCRIYAKWADSPE